MEDNFLKRNEENKRLRAEKEQLMSKQQRWTNGACHADDGGCPIPNEENKRLRLKIEGLEGQQQRWSSERKNFQGQLAKLNVLTTERFPTPCSHDSKVYDFFFAYTGPMF